MKGGHEFATTGGCTVVNFSQGMMGARLPQKEWEPNMVELEVRVAFDERQRSNQDGFFKVIPLVSSAGCFYIIYGKEIPKQEIE